MNQKQNVLFKEQLFGTRARAMPVPRISGQQVARHLRQRIRDGDIPCDIAKRVEAAAVEAQHFQPDRMLCREQAKDSYIVFLPALSLADVKALYPERFDESWKSEDSPWKHEPIQAGFYVFSRDFRPDSGTGSGAGPGKQPALHPVVWLLNSILQRCINKITVEDVYSAPPATIVCGANGKVFAVFSENGRYAVENEENGWYCDISAGTPEVQQL